MPVGRPVARAARYVTWGEVCFFVAIDLCIVLLPSVAVHHFGLSHFGVRLATVVPYTVGLLLAGWFMVRAARVLPPRTQTLKVLTRALVVLAALVVGVSLTPFSVDALFGAAHVATSGALFFGELVLACWLVFAHARDRVNVLLVVLQVGAGLLAFASEVGAVNRMLVGEMLTQAAFGFILVRSLNRLAAAWHQELVLPGRKGSRG